MTSPEIITIEISPDASIELVRIPAGEFTLGSGANAQRLMLDEFYIGKYPLTNEQYSEFLQDTNHVPPEHWVGRLTPPQNIRTHPVAAVEWRDAQAFVEWLSDMSGKKIHLPSEAQWEKAARGPSPSGDNATSSEDGRIYPWGNTWIDAGEAPVAPRIYIGDDTWVQVRTVAVGSTSPQTDSPYGCADMCCNVWEWCSSAGRDYPYDPSDGREDLAQRDGVLRVLRGAAFNPLPGTGGKERFDATQRHFAPPHESRDIYGFRIALG